jgi:hypothetical protein
MNPSIHAKHMECNYFPLPSKFEMLPLNNEIGLTSGGPPFKGLFEIALLTTSNNKRIYHMSHLHIQKAYVALADSVVN